MKAPAKSKWRVGCILSVLAGIVLAGVPAWAQWTKVPAAKIPRTADGRPDLSAPTPRLPDGTPDRRVVTEGQQVRP